MLVDLGREIIAINTANGWNAAVPGDWGNDAYKVPAILALIHSEVSEALEAFREKDRGNFDEELADIMIRVIGLAAGLGINLDVAVASKLKKNAERSYRHGGKVL